VDESGSMSRDVDGRPPSDPGGWRWVGPSEGAAFLGSLRYQQNQDATIRVAIIHFGDRPKLGMAWTDINPKNQSDYQKLLDNLKPYFDPQPDLGNTNPLSAFQNASSLFDMLPQQVGNCPRRVVIVLTDGQPAIPSVSNFSWQAHLKELAKYVQSYMPAPGHQIYVLGLDQQNSYWQNNKPYWDQVTGDPARAIRVTSARELAEKLREILSGEAKNLFVTGGRTLEECVEGGEVVVRPFVQQVRMTYFKPDVSAHLAVEDEAGRPIEPTRRDMKVQLDGYDELIETLTVELPQPGIWEITNPGPNSPDGALICILSFIAEGEITTPQDGAVLEQFTQEPLELRIVDVNGNRLPDYHDQKYLPKVEVSLVPPTMITETIPMVAGPLYEFEGKLVPQQSGPNTVSVRATSQDPKGAEFEIFNAALATYSVAPVSYRLLEPPESQVGQHSELKLKFALQDAQGNTVQPDMAPSLAVTLTQPSKSELMAPVQAADGSWDLAFTLSETGKHTLSYETVAQTVGGPLAVAHDEVSFDVYATTPVMAQFVAPKGSYGATDMFLRPTGLPLQVQLVDDKGNALGPGQVGAVNPMGLFAVTVTDDQAADRSAELLLGNTGKPGLFSAQGKTLGPGKYEVVVKPGSELAREYMWAADEWTATVTGRINMLFLVPVAAAVALLALIAAIVLGSLAVRRHPLSGYIEIYEEVMEPAISEDGSPRSYKRSAFLAQLPNRNRVVYRSGSWRQSQSTIPARYIKVTCPSQDDANAKRAHAVIALKDGGKMDAILSPDSPPFPIGLGYLLEKGPRAYGGYDADLTTEVSLDDYGTRS
jgi:hypothetical protein